MATTMFEQIINIIKAERRNLKNKTSMFLIPQSNKAGLVN